MTKLNFMTITYSTVKPKFLSTLRKHRFEFVGKLDKFVVEVFGIRFGPIPQDQLRCRNCDVVIVTVPDSLDFVPKRGCRNGSFF